jgi:hypothetical protein
MWDSVLHEEYRRGASLAIFFEVLKVALCSTNFIRPTNDDELIRGEMPARTTPVTSSCSKSRIAVDGIDSKLPKRCRLSISSDD